MMIFTKADIFSIKLIILVVILKFIVTFAVQYNFHMQNDNKMKQLTEKEEELIRKLWTKEEMTARELLEMYPEPRPHFNTVATFLRILEQKGWVAHRPIGNTHLYRAVVTETEMGRRSMRSIMSRFFKGSLSGMVSAFLEDENLTEEEIKELQAMIESKKGNK